jgi:hypothetical protein
MSFEMKQPAGFQAQECSDLTHIYSRKSTMEVKQSGKSVWESVVPCYCRFQGLAVQASQQDFFCRALYIL